VFGSDLKTLTRQDTGRKPDVSVFLESRAIARRGPVRVRGLRRSVSIRSSIERSAPLKFSPSTPRAATSRSSARPRTLSQQGRVGISALLRVLPTRDEPLSRLGTISIEGCDLLPRDPSIKDRHGRSPLPRLRERHSGNGSVLFCKTSSNELPSRAETVRGGCCCFGQPEPAADARLLTARTRLFEP
jgi:hypothetical protein